MIDAGEPLRILWAWYDRYSYLSKKSDAHYAQLTRVFNALEAMDKYVEQTEALHDEIRRLRVQAALSENWGERYAVLLTALYATADGATYRAVRAYETDEMRRDAAHNERIAVFEATAAYRAKQQAQIKQTLMRRENLTEGEYFEYIIMRSANNE